MHISKFSEHIFNDCTCSVRSGRRLAAKTIARNPFGTSAFAQTKSTESFPRIRVVFIEFPYDRYSFYRWIRLPLFLTYAGAFGCRSYSLKRRLAGVMKKKTTDRPNVLFVVDRIRFFVLLLRNYELANAPSFIAISYRRRRVSYRKRRN